jgi:hypothetical protein
MLQQSMYIIDIFCYIYHIVLYVCFLRCLLLLVCCVYMFEGYRLSFYTLHRLTFYNSKITRFFSRYLLRFTLILSKCAKLFLNIIYIYRNNIFVILFMLRALWSKSILTIFFQIFLQVSENGHL